MRTQVAWMLCGVALAVSARAQETEVVVGEARDVVVGYPSPGGIKLKMQFELLLPSLYAPARVCKPEMGDAPEEWCGGVVIPVPSSFLKLTKSGRSGLGLTGFAVNFLTAGKHDRWQLLTVGAMFGSMGRDNYAITFGGGVGVFQEHRWRGRPKEEFFGKKDPYRIYLKFGVATGIHGDRYAFVSFSYRMGKP